MVACRILHVENTWILYPWNQYTKTRRGLSIVPEIRIKQPSPRERPPHVVTFPAAYSVSIGWLCRHAWLHLSTSAFYMGLCGFFFA